ncbi:MAG: hypothetical protein P8Q50_08050 [Octadecabacter sp.]|nr:hypothetical protein [Octadecabacter sp.]
MRWLDWLILALLAGITGYIGLRMQGALVRRQGFCAPMQIKSGLQPCAMITPYP